MHILARVRHPKRLLAGIAVSGLILVLAGCGSPGAIGANSAAFSDGFPGDTANFSFVCSLITTPGVGNCAGKGSGTISGMAFKTLTANGATFTLTDNNCQRAPCPEGGKLRVYGQAQYGAQQVSYHFQGQDFDPATATDVFQLTLGATVRTFHCNGCVEVVMEPGQIPNSVYAGQ